jgi:hypothetical protein
MDLFARQAQGSSSRLQELLGEVQQRYGNKALRLGQDLGVKS